MTLNFLAAILPVALRLSLRICACVNVNADTLNPIGKEYISRHLGMAMVPGKHVVKVLAMLPDAV